MAIKIKFDSSHNPIQPTFVLSTRSGHKIGYIPAYNISISDTFNSKFDLSFQVNKYSNGTIYSYWEDLSDFKLVWCKEWDVWFEIYVETQDNNDLTKNIDCVSIGEAELSQINLYNIESNTEDDISRDDYSPTVLYNENAISSSLLHRIMGKVPHYSISHVDASISHIQRTFSFDNISLYDAFQKISEEIGCIFVINPGSNPDGSIKRSISVYDLESCCMDCGHRDTFDNKCPSCGSTNILKGYGRDTNIFISTENLADDISLSTDTDSVKNCFRLEAGDDLMTSTVINCNPNGSQYIWYISKDSKKDMSDELRKKLDDYDAVCDNYNQYGINISASVLNRYNSIVAKYIKYNKDLQEIKSPIYGYPNLMNIYYDTIDLCLFLTNSLMPDTTISKTTASIQAAKLNSTNISSVAVQDISKCSAATAASAVLSIAKTIIDSGYQVKIKDGNLSGTKWIGNFTVTSYSDDSDTSDSDVITVIITDDYKAFTKQKIDKVLKKSADDSNIYAISSLFKTEIGTFKTEIKKHCLENLKMFSNACQSCLDIMIENGIGDKDLWENKESDLYKNLYIPYYEKKIALEEELQIRESEIEAIIGSYDTDGNLKVYGLQNELDSERIKIQNALNFENYLGDSLWREFVSYIREDVYSNDNYISDGLNNGELFKKALEFINTAKKEIFKSSTLQHSLSATLKNLLVMKEFEPIVDNFSVGNWIHIKIDNEVYRLRLISYSIDFDDLDNINIEFSDITKISTGISDIQSILSQAHSMATSYDSIKRQASQGENSNSILKSWIRNGLDATNTKIIGGADNQTQTWDEHGMLFRRYNDITDSYEETQLKIINSTIAITNDNWGTTKTAIGNFYYYDPATEELKSAYGINGEAIIGKIFLGEQLGIYNDAGNLKFNNDGFVITNGVNSFTVNPNNAKKLLALSSGNTDVLYVDEKGLLHIQGDGAGLDITTNSAISDLSSKVKLTAEGLETKVAKNNIISTINQSAEEVSISANKINFNGLVTANEYFKILLDGSIQASHGTIGGVDILSDGLYMGGYLTGDRGMIYKCGMSSSDQKHAFWAGEDKWYVDYNGFMHAEKVDLGGRFQTATDDTKVIIDNGRVLIYERVPVEDMETGEIIGYDWNKRIYIGINTLKNPAIVFYDDFGEDNVISLNKNGLNGKVATYDGDYKYAVGSSAANIWRTKIIRTITSSDGLKKLLIWGGYGEEGSADTGAEQEEESHYFLDQSAVLSLITDACQTLQNTLQSQIDALKK